MNATAISHTNHCLATVSHPTLLKIQPRSNEHVRMKTSDCTMRSECCLGLHFPPSGLRLPSRGLGVNVRFTVKLLHPVGRSKKKFCWQGCYPVVRNKTQHILARSTFIKNGSLLFYCVTRSTAWGTRTPDNRFHSFKIIRFRFGKWLLMTHTWWQRNNTGTKTQHILAKSTFINNSYVCCCSTRNQSD